MMSKYLFLVFAFVAMSNTDQASDTAALTLGSPTSLDIEEKRELECRLGYVEPPAPQAVLGLPPVFILYIIRFRTCLRELVLLGEQSGAFTRECARICVWKQLGFADPSGRLNRTTVENDVTVQQIFPGPESPGRKDFIDDMESCWNKTKPDIFMSEYANGCNTTKKFTKCFEKKSNKSCVKAKLSSNPISGGQIQEDHPKDR